MSTLSFEELERALHRRGDPLSVGEFMDVLAETARHPEALSAGEREFLLENTDLESQDLSAEAQAQARVQVMSAAAAAEKHVEAASFTTKEVAHMLGRAEPNIRRSRLQGDLYAVVTTHPGGALRFPQWQFTAGNTVVPGLRRVIPVLPGDYHPWDVEAFMTAPQDALSAQTPAQWLATGGSVDAVIALADELSYV